MIRKMLLLAVTALGVSGCVAVPVYETAPPYGYSYGPPAASVTFGYYGAPPRPRHHHHHDRPRGDRLHYR